jgi:predicted RNA-binding Zn-ribbon protein involved in translation (DUF1610 family)
MTDSTDPMLTAFLAQSDQPCPQCEYNLRNLTGNRCPECGEELVLRVNLAEPRQRLLLAGLIGLAAGTGFNGLLILYAVISSLRSPYGVPRAVWFVTFSGFLIIGTAMLVWLSKWRSLRQLLTSARVVLVLGCWLISLIDIVIFSFAIR